MSKPRLDDLLKPWRAAPADGAVLWPSVEEAVSFARFAGLVAAAGRWLDAEGVREGDRVAVWLPNRVEWLALFFAMARAGVTLVAVNSRYRAAEVDYILKASGASRLILQTGFKGIDFPGILDGVDPAGLPDLRAVSVLSGTAEGAGGKAAALPGTLLGRPVSRCDLRPVPGDVPPGDVLPPDRDSDPDAALVFFTTSGTTRSPKLVVHSQATLTLHSQRVAVRFGFDRDGTAPRAGLFAAMPFCGVFGLNAALGAIAGGAALHLCAAFDAADAAARIARHRLTHVIGSDEMMARLLEVAGRVEGRDEGEVEGEVESHVDGGDPVPAALASLRLCGFASFTPGLAGQLRAAAAAGLPLRGLYGSSEVNALFSLQDADLPLDERLKGGGRTTSADARVRIVDPQTGAALPVGQAGALEIRAPTSFTGYYRNPEAMADAMTADGFFRTGDIGMLRADGSFVYVTRAGDAIRLGGFLVDPAEIEEVLKTLPGVADAQVVAVERDGKLCPVAFVTRAARGGFDEASVLAAAAERLAAFKRPVRVFALDAFPVTQSANGMKVQRAKLRDMAAEMLAADPVG
ncbi:MAG: AMP-binding protein [Alphaproteobacteria bacterium]|nr:AMP-binding protein [Alphaproteobacteria bacterium]MBO6864259.1 AMP-binding protein [Alphaproteobacteria bacterium]